MGKKNTTASENEYRFAFDIKEKCPMCSIVTKGVCKKYLGRELIETESLDLPNHYCNPLEIVSRRKRFCLSCGEPIYHKNDKDRWIEIRPTRKQVVRQMSLYGNFCKECCVQSVKQNPKKKGKKKKNNIGEIFKLLKK